jgi:hypothetical protein
MNELYELGKQVAHSLNDAGFSNQADEILILCNRAVNQDALNAEREAALIQIEMRCHARWLGDLYLPDTALQEWWRQLEKLSKSARKQRKFLQASCPVQQDITNLIGCRVRICENDLFGATNDVIIRLIDGGRQLLLLEFLSSKKVGKYNYSFAVVRPRANTTFEEFTKSKQLSCSLTCIPREQYNPKTPFDLSWWRGGGVAIVDIYLVTPVAPLES